MSAKLHQKEISRTSSTGKGRVAKSSALQRPDGSADSPVKSAEASRSATAKTLVSINPAVASGSKRVVAATTKKSSRPEKTVAPSKKSSASSAGKPSGDGQANVAGYTEAAATDVMVEREVLHDENDSLKFKSLNKKGNS